MKKVTVYLKNRVGQIVPSEVVQVRSKWGSLELWIEERETKPQISVEGLTPLEEAERDVITDYLKKLGGIQRQVAIQLGITINTLKANIVKYGIKFERVW